MSGHIKGYVNGVLDGEFSGVIDGEMGAVVRARDRVQQVTPGESGEDTPLLGIEAAEEKSAGGPEAPEDPSVSTGESSLPEKLSASTGPEVPAEENMSPSPESAGMEENAHGHGGRKRRKSLALGRRAQERQKGAADHEKR